MTEFEEADLIENTNENKLKTDEWNLDDEIKQIEYIEEDVIDTSTINVDSSALISLQNEKLRKSYKDIKNIKEKQLWLETINKEIKLLESVNT